MHSFHEVKFLFLHILALFSILRQKSQHLRSWWMWLSFSFYLPFLPQPWVQGVLLNLLNHFWGEIEVEPEANVKVRLTLALSTMDCSISMFHAPCPFACCCLRFLFVWFPVFCTFLSSDPLLLLYQGLIALVSYFVEHTAILDSFLSTNWRVSPPILQGSAEIQRYRILK